MRNRIIYSRHKGRTTLCLGILRVQDRYFEGLVIGSVRFCLTSLSRMRTFISLSSECELSSLLHATTAIVSRKV
jgi:hypothetical protein